MRFRFSILRCTYLEEPFQHVHLLPTLRETTLQSDRRQTCPELGITFPCAALRYSHAKLSGSRQAERMDSNHQAPVTTGTFPITYTFRLTRIPGLAIGLSCYACHELLRTSCPSTFYKEVRTAYASEQNHIDSNDTCRKLHPLFNLQKVSVSIKGTHRRKEESMKKCLCQAFLLTNLPHKYILPQTFQKVVVHVFS